MTRLGISSRDGRAHAVAPKADPLLWGIIGTAAFLGLMYIALWIVLGAGHVVAEIPSFVPMAHGFIGLACFSVAVLALGRYQALGDRTSYWIGVACAVACIGTAFYILAWPGLLPNGRGLIAHVSSTAAWIITIVQGALGAFLLAAALAREPGRAPGRSEVERGLGPVAAWLISATLVCVLVVRFEEYLPPLMGQGGIYLKLIIALQILEIPLFGVGAVIATRRYRTTGDALLGYLAIVQVALCFAEVAVVIGTGRYDIWWFLSRLVGTGGIVAAMFGLLLEHVRLYRREREKTRELEVTMAERREASEALARSEERLRLAQVSARVGTFDWDIPGNLMDGTPEVEALYGLARNTFGGTYEYWRRLLHPDDLPRVEAAIQQAMSGGTVEIEFRVIWPDGTVHWLFARGHVSTDASGKPLRMIGINLDITESKRAEEALRASEQRFRAFFETPSVGTAEVDLQGRFMAVNDRYCQITGYSREELVGMTVMEVMHPDDRPDDGRLLTNHLGGQTPMYEMYEAEQRCRRKDGSTVWVHVTAGLLRDAEGKPLRSTGIIQDITDRKRAEEAAEAANQAKDHFLAVLSHELRTPLTAVLPVLEDLAGRVPEEAREDVEMARRNVELEARLIDDLLDVTRIERGKIELHRERTDLETIVRRAAEVCAPDIEARRLNFDIEVEGGPCPVDADPARLQQVFWNLIKNAIKFTPHGGCIGIHSFRDGDGHVLAEVRDSGIGIEPQDLSRIFNAFEQVDRSVTRQFGGLGLGLAISKALVDLHGGTIQAHSEGKGKGAVFTVKLPIHKEFKEKAASPEPRQTTLTQIPAVTRPLEILLVEDHGDTAKIMRRMLQAKGHKVEMAGDVATALELAQERSFDLVLSDLGLPDRSGLELMQELRRMGQRMPGIALSGYGQQEDIRRAREAGFNEHLTKPIGLAQLEAVIGRVTAGQAVEA